MNHPDDTKRISFIERVKTVVRDPSDLATLLSLSKRKCPNDDFLSDEETDDALEQSRDPRPFFGAHSSQVLDGVPVKVMKPRVTDKDSSPEFWHTHAFSKDKSRLATVTKRGQFSVWSMTDYTLIDAINCFDEKAKPGDNVVLAMSFLAADNGSFIAVANCGDYNVQNGRIKLLNFRINKPSSTQSSSSGAQSTLELLDTVELGGVTAPNIRESAIACLSDDGMTMAYIADYRRALEPIHLVRLDVNGELISDVLLHPPGYKIRLPFLAKNGQSLFVLCAKQTEAAQKDHRSLEDETKLVVFPNLKKNGDAEWIQIQGQRAAWGLDGQFLLVWEYQSATPQSLSIYSTVAIEDAIQRERCLVPIQTKTIEYGAYDVAATVVSCSRKKESIDVLVYIINRPGGGRLFFWNAFKNVDSREIEVAIDLHKDSAKTTSHSSSDVSTMPRVNPWPPTTIGDYRAVLNNDQHPNIRLSKDKKWAAVYSRELNHGVIIAMRSGVTVWGYKLDRGKVNPHTYWADVLFDSSGQHLIAASANGVYAHSPLFLRPERMNPDAVDCDVRHCMDGGSKEGDVVKHALQMLPPVATAFSCWQWKSRCLVGDSLALDSEGDRFSKETLICDSALSANGLRLVYLDAGRQKTFRSISLFTWDLSERGTRNGSTTLDKLGVNIEDNIDEYRVRVFLYPRQECETGEESICWLFTLCGRTSAVFFATAVDVTAGGIVDYDIGGWIAAQQSADRRRVLTIHNDKVCILCLQKRQIIHIIPYTIDISKGVVSATSYPLNLGGVRSRRIVTDDGQRILLYCNAEGKSIFVVPETTQEEFEKIIADREQKPKHYCTLSPDGELTLFLDRHESDDKRFPDVVMYSNSRKHSPVAESQLCMFDVGGEVLHKFSLHHRLGRPRSTGGTPSMDFIYVGISHNNAEIAVHVNLDGRTLQIAPFTLHDTEKSLPRHSLFVHSGFATETVKELFSIHGVSMFSAPDSEGRSVYSRALWEKNDAALKSISKLCKHDEALVSPALTSCAETAQTTNPSALESSNAYNPKDVLEAALRDKSSDGVRTVLHGICSGKVPFNTVSALLKTHFQTLLAEHRPIMEEAFRENIFLFDSCQLEVHSDYLNERNRTYKGIHVKATDSFLEWKSQKDDPNSIGSKWDHEHAEEGEKMRKNGNNIKKTAAMTFVGIEDAAHVGNNGIIRPLLQSHVPESIFVCEAVKWVILHKWFNVWKPRFVTSVGFYAAFLIAFTSYAIRIASSDEISEEDFRWNIITACLLALPVGFGMRMIYGEIVQILTFIDDAKSRKDGLQYYFNSIWNVMDLVSSILLTIVIPILHGLAVLYPTVDAWLAIAIAFEAVLAYVKIWYYAQPFHDAGALVLLVYNVIIDSLIFMGLGVAILCGFALGLHVLFQHVVETDVAGGATDNSPCLPSAEKANHNVLNNETGVGQADCGPSGMTSPDDDTGVGEFMNFGRSLETLFFALIGNFEIDIFHSSSNYSWLLTIFMIFYIMAESIVLLNLFIAIMSDTFDRVKNTEDAQLLMSRASFIDASEAELSKKEKEIIDKTQPRFVCALKENAETMKSAETWKGRVEMIRRSLRDNIRSLANEIKQSVSKTDEKLANMERKLEAILSKLNDSRAQNASPSN